MGASNRSAVGTLAERTTRFVILVKMDGTTATDAMVGFSDKMYRVPRSLRLWKTSDQGSEMVKHAEIAQRIGTAIYFSDPHSPSQRGSNENTNGLLRQYLPKGTDLSMKCPPPELRRLYCSHLEGWIGEAQRSMENGFKGRRKTSASSRNLNCWRQMRCRARHNCRFRR